MKVAILSDIHDNLARLTEALEIVKKENIEIGICCGDVTSIETLEILAAPFKTLYLALGNADFKLAQTTGMIPENVKWFERFGAMELSGKKIAIVHRDNEAKNVAAEGVYDLVFYGHTHTPWEKKIGRTTILNPGEVSGQFGPASFCIYNLESMKGQLKIIQ